MTKNFDEHLKLTANIVRAYVGNNPIPKAELPELIANVSTALQALAPQDAEPKEELVPAVNPKRSVFPDYIVSLENGQKFKALRRHLTSRGMTPEQYRAKWGLPADYPMVAQSYASTRSDLAKTMGLGRKAARAEGGGGTTGGEAVEISSVTGDVPTPKRRGRKPKAEI